MTKRAAACRLAALATTAFLGLSPVAPAGAETLQFCLINRAWVYWDATLSLTEVQKLPDGSYSGMTIPHGVILELGKHKCWDVTPGYTASITSIYDNCPIIERSTRSMTFRLDGTIFSNKCTTLDGVNLN